MHMPNARLSRNRAFTHDRYFSSYKYANQLDFQLYKSIPYGLLLFTHTQQYSSLDKQTLSLLQ
jgi:hypothetical protein